MKYPLVAAVALAFVASGAAADPVAPSAPSNAAPPERATADPKSPEPNKSLEANKAPEPNKAKAARDGELTADMDATLRKAGFTDLQILPNSVFVRGKDKAGNPVAMVLNPGSMTEVVTLDPHAGTAASGNGAPAPLTGSGTFATILPTERLASSLIGAPVVDTAGETIGTIKDIAVDHGGVHAYILGVGGLFGIGDRYVAVTPGALALAFDSTTKGYRATMSATIDQLKAAPEFTYGDLAAKRD